MTEHIPVLLHESIDGLHIQPEGVYIDGTINAGGHSIEICKRLSDKGVLIGIDQDGDALKLSEKNLMGCSCKVSLHNTNFRYVDAVLDEVGISHIDGILLDIGLSNRQLEDSGRGFSFKYDEPLLMTFKTEVSEDDTTAQTILNEWEEESIADIIYGFGGEKYSRRIAHKIVEKRKESPIERTEELVSIIYDATPVGYHNRKTHPATKTFQALRIAVNDEYGALKEVISTSINRLNKKGRIAIISFHSGEDRIVKMLFKEFAKTGEILIHTKKPITPTEEEISNNPKSRSAMLRIAEKI